MSFKLKKKKKNTKTSNESIMKLEIEEIKPSEEDIIESTRIKLEGISTLTTDNVQQNNLLNKPSALAKIISDIKPDSINKEMVL